MSTRLPDRRAWLVLVALVVAACGSSGGSPASTGAPATATASPAPSASIGRPAGSVNVPGTEVWMVPKAPFVAATSFAGFGESNGAAIEVTPVAEPYATLAPQVDEATLSEQGITMDTRDSVTLPDGSEGILISGTQTIDGRDFQKVILVTGDDESAALITANVPFSAMDDIEPAVVAMLLSTTWGPA